MTSRFSLFKIAALTAAFVAVAPFVVGAQSEAVGRGRTMEGNLRVQRAEKIERAKAHGRRMIRREQAAIERLRRMIERVESRLAKLRAAGKDVAALEPLVSEAKAKRDAAIAAVKEASAKYEALGTGDKPRQIAQEANAATKNVKKALVELHTILKQIITALKAVR
ncbi:hypothetical protein HYZ80_00635 [Candidatus Parcubacteria bacterium]|nr:hypothetical protein [Candidatus Parcubacteria bacterium]